MAGPLSRIPESPEIYKAKARSQLVVCGLMAVRKNGKRKQAKLVREAESLADRIQRAYAQEPRLRELTEQQDLRFRDGF